MWCNIDNKYIWRRRKKSTIFILLISTNGKNIIIILILITTTPLFLVYHSTSYSVFLPLLVGYQIAAPKGRVNGRPLKSTKLHHIEEEENLKKSCSARQKCVISSVIISSYYEYQNIIRETIKVVQVFICGEWYDIWLDRTLWKAKYRFVHHLCMTTTPIYYSIPDQVVRSLCTLA